MSEYFNLAVYNWVPCSSCEYCDEYSCCTRLARLIKNDKIISKLRVDKKRDGCSFGDVKKLYDNIKIWQEDVCGSS